MGPVAPTTSLRTKARVLFWRIKLHYCEQKISLATSVIFSFLLL